MLSYMLPVSEKPPLPPAGLATAAGGGVGGGGGPCLQLALSEPANGAALNGTPSAARPTGPAPRPGPGVPVPVGASAPAVTQPPPPHSAPPAGSLPTDSSISSLSSSEVGTTPSSQSTATPTDARPRAKLQANGKHPTLKRVSFGSSKGSMVETLVYESPLREEPEAISPSPDSVNAVLLSGPAGDPDALAESKRVRVSFFECQRPVPLPPADVDAATPVVDAVMAMAVSSPEPANIGYQRQASTDSGWDNPFRPDGNLSREADEIVELIKGGKPITPTSGAAPAPAADAASAIDGVSVPDGAAHAATASPQQTAAPGSPAAVASNAASLQNSAKVGANGNAAVTGGVGVPGDTQKANAPGSVEVQRGTVDASQAVEHVVLKKKQKCKCCVIQ